MTLSQGSIRKRTWRHNGHRSVAYEFTIRVDGKRTRRQYPTKAEAQEALDQFKMEQRNPAPPAVVAAPTMTLAQAFARYDQVKARKRSLAEDQRMADHLMAEFGKDTLLSAITAGRISEYKARRLAIEKSRRGGKLSAASINRPLMLLRHLLVLAATEWEILAAVPRIKLEKEPQGRIRWLEPDEEHRLIEACRASALPHLGDLVTVALESGMRKGELLGLTWDRVDFSRGVLRLEVTKSGRRREVPMRQAVYDVFSARPGAREGRVWPAGSVRKSFGKAVEAAKPDTPFRFHDTRHHFASWFVIRGGALPALQQILGHASLSMTLRYAHLSPKHLRDEIEKTERDGRKVDARMVDSDVSRGSSVAEQLIRNQ